ncbi:MAG TPA: SPOR domain-containing protein, partial [Thermodesulfobacteriota bacterium]|nr:SPOR domain-containing protein [Thermodesulfobacteriota bacterium]
ELTLLAVSAPNGGRRIQIIFAGEPEIKEGPGMRKRVAARDIDLVAELQPLAAREIPAYISHRSKAAGRDAGEIFTREAIALIGRYSEGIPRMINVLCDNAFLIGFGLSRKKLDSQIVIDVLEDLKLVSPDDFSGGGVPLPKAPGDIRLPARATGSPALKKLSYSLLALAGVVAFIFLGRIYLKSPEAPSVRFPIMQPVPQGVGWLVAPEKTGPGEAPKTPEGVQEKTVPSAAPATGDRTDSGRVVKKAIPPPPTPPPAAAGDPGPIRKEFVVKGGDSLYTMASRTYKVANTSVMDRILEANPGISNPGRIPDHTKVRIPEITEESLVVAGPNGTSRIRVGTFLKPEYAAFLKKAPALKGKQMDVVPHRFASGETWYRVTAGPFKTREEGLQSVRELKGQGLLPYFENFRFKK